MGKYPCLGVADSTTYYAREMLHQTSTWVKEFHPCEVVYGDTDSVMVKFQGTKTVEESFTLEMKHLKSLQNNSQKSIILIRLY